MHVCDEYFLIQKWMKILIDCECGDEKCFWVFFIGDLCQVHRSSWEHLESIRWKCATIVHISTGSTHFKHHHNLPRIELVNCLLCITCCKLLSLYVIIRLRSPFVSRYWLCSNHKTASSSTSNAVSYPHVYSSLA